MVAVCFFFALDTAELGTNAVKMLKTRHLSRRDAEDKIALEGKTVDISTNGAKYQLLANRHSFVKNK